MMWLRFSVSHRLSLDSTLFVKIGVMAVSDAGLCWIRTEHYQTDVYVFRSCCVGICDRSSSVCTVCVPCACGGEEQLTAETRVVSSAKLFTQTHVGNLLKLCC